jgi:very-short-patch-repair endonuclease
VDALAKLVGLGIPGSVLDPDSLIGIDRVSGSSVVRIVCACGVRKDLKVASVLRTISRSGGYRCVSCAMKAKHSDPSYQESHRVGLIKSWTDEKRQKQSYISKSLWEDSAFAKKITDSSAKAWESPERRREASLRTSLLWEDPHFRARYETLWSDPVWREEDARRARALWDSPDYRAQQEAFKSDPQHRIFQSDLAKARWEDPEYRSMVVKSQSLLWEDPRLRKEMSQRTKELWADPAYVEKQRLASLSPDLIRIKSENAKRQWGNREFRERMAEALSQHLLGGKDSILERTAQTLLSALGIPYVRHHVVGHFEFDLFIPGNNLLVECNGEYWHSLRKDRDAAKFTYVNEYFPQYRVLYLWERDFLNPGLVRQKLVRELFGGDDPEEQVDFSFDDVSVRPLSAKDKAPGSYYSVPEEFLQSFHYAGYGRGAKAVYGAYVGDVLVALGKFSSPVRQEVASSMGLRFSEVLELDRLCVDPRFQKKNFGSWFLSRLSRLVFSDFPSVSVLVSFADSTFGHDGTVYRASNWTFEHVVRPDYHYVGPGGFVIHKKTLWNHSSKNGRTESDYAAENGYVRAYGREKLKFSLRRP